MVSQMNIGHVAIWAKDLEIMKDFYIKYFNGRAGKRYINEARQFSSYFITFETGSRLEIMHMPSISGAGEIKDRQSIGLAHIAFSTGSIENVHSLTERLRLDGFKVVDGPRKTGDGYFESVIVDPEENRIEITV